jgi:serine/threonine protein kinase
LAIIVIAVVIGLAIEHPALLILIGAVVGLVFFALYMTYLKQTKPAEYQKVKDAPAQLAAKAKSASLARKQNAAQRKQLQDKQRTQKLRLEAQEKAQREKTKIEAAEKKQQEIEYEEAKRKARDAQAAFKKEKQQSQAAANNKQGNNQALPPPAASNPKQIDPKPKQCGQKPDPQIETGGSKMEGLLKIGTVLTAESGVSYKVLRLLGAGGQGEVYAVEKGGAQYALKWYFKNMATRQQKLILDNLIAKGAPDSTFLWPQDMIEQGANSFGYIMPLRPSPYRSIVDLMKRRAEPSFYSLCRAAYNLTLGYQKLHSMGFSYRDISFGNLFLEPNSGDVLICDNDNVAANSSDSAVYGTPRFMAPEIVIGKAKPSRNTDLFSLAVLLFYMFMLNHPLEGALEAKIKCMDMPAMNQLYGKNPVFIFDPQDKSNRPVEGYQDNAKIFWGLYPWKLQDLFLHSFTIGLREPNKRVTENQWLEAFANLTSGIVKCGNCGAEVFYDEKKSAANVTHTCWNCKKDIALPIAIEIGKSIVLLNSGAKLYSHHIKGDFDMATIAGSLAQNPGNPALWGIRNDTAENWTYIKADGTQIPVAPGKSAAIAKGAKIDFGQLKGAFAQI